MDPVMADQQTTASDGASQRDRTSDCQLCYGEEGLWGNAFPLSASSDTTPQERAGIGPAAIFKLYAYAGLTGSQVALYVALGGALTFAPAIATPFIGCRCPITIMVDPHA